MLIKHIIDTYMLIKHVIDNSISPIHAHKGWSSGCFFEVVSFTDSKLSRTCDYCLHYKSDNMQEPFKLVPTCSIVVQVSSEVQCSNNYMYLTSHLLEIVSFVTRPVKIDHLGTKISDFLSVLYHNLIKIFITTAEFNGLSYAAYRNGILHSEWKRLAKI